VVSRRLARILPSGQAVQPPDPAAEQVLQLESQSWHVNEVVSPYLPSGQVPTAGFVCVWFAFGSSCGLLFFSGQPRPRPSK
jgi:hypothetical protein